MGKKLYVGNLAYAVTQDDLAELFAQAGKVESAVVVSDKFSGQSRGFGFVEFKDDSHAKAAIAGLNGKEAGGRNLKVNEARPKGESGPPRGPKTFGNKGGGYNKGGKGGGRDRFSNEDYRESARQPREPRW